MTYKELVNHEHIEVGHDNTRKYSSIMKDTAGRNMFDGFYSAIIEEKSQYEHAKKMTDILEDIFNHTDARVAFNTEKLVEMYNKQRGEDMDPVWPSI